MSGSSNVKKPSEIPETATLPSMHHQQFWVGRHFRGGIKKAKTTVLTPYELEQICYSPKGIKEAMKQRSGNIQRV